MKKLLVAATLMLGLIIGQAAQAEAAVEHYLGEWEGGWEAYLVASSLDIVKYEHNKSPSHIIFSCVVKAVSPSGTVKNIDYFIDIYIEDNPRIYFKNSLGVVGAFYMESPGRYRVEQMLARYILGYIRTYFEQQR